MCRRQEAHLCPLGYRSRAMRFTAPHLLLIGTSRAGFQFQDVIFSQILFPRLFSITQGRQYQQAANNRQGDADGQQ